MFLSIPGQIKLEPLVKDVTLSMAKQCHPPQTISQKIAKTISQTQLRNIRAKSQKLRNIISQHERKIAKQFRINNVAKSQKNFA
jgi:hypothetical protein